ncbi:hypothetical protein V1512DRAFT_218441 [Lipomyces arxii]|uniref:uncharacterized protein n=1 Tax=Lipomyces arxii TaxID=56418 RepID=UPI0034CFFC02
MSTAALEAIAARNLRAILPLDDDTRLQIMRYASSLGSADEAAGHLKGILGEEPMSLDFIHDFCSRRWPTKSASRAKTRTPIGAAKSSTGLKKVVTKPTGIRQPVTTKLADIGDVYMKSEEDDYYSLKKAVNLKTATPEPTAQPVLDHASPSRSATQEVSNMRTSSLEGRQDPQWRAPTPFLGQHIGAYDPSIRQGRSTVLAHATTQPAAAAPMTAVTPSLKATKVAASHTTSDGVLVSDLLSPKKKHSKGAIADAIAERTGPTSIKVKSLQEVDEAVRLLEQYNNSGQRRICNCQAQRHPLLQVAPNCLNCGKIICVREGLGPCTFCHTPLLEQSEYMAILAELRQERGQIKTEISNERARKVTAGGPSRQSYSSSAGGHDNVRLPVFPGLDRANDQLSNLLSYQANSTQRTKIIDNASDFELPGQSTDKWATAAERAKQLRKQERTLKMNEAIERQRNGRGKQVISIDLKGNRTVVSQQSQIDYESSSDEDDIDTNDAIKKQTGFSAKTWNPDKDRAGFITPMYVHSHLEAAATSKIKSDNLTSILPAAVQQYESTVSPDVRKPSRVQEDDETEDPNRDLFDFNDDDDSEERKLKPNTRQPRHPKQNFSNVFKDLSASSETTETGEFDTGYEAEPARGYDDDIDNRSRRFAETSRSATAVHVLQPPSEEKFVAELSMTARKDKEASMKSTDDPDSAVAGSSLSTSTSVAPIRARSKGIDSADENDDSDDDLDEVIGNYNKRPPKNSSQWENPYVRPLSPSISSASDKMGGEEYQSAEEESESEEEGPYEGFVGVAGGDDNAQFNEEDYDKAFGSGKKIKKWHRSKTTEPDETDEQEDQEEEGGGRGVVPQDEKYINDFQEAQASWVSAPTTGF